MGGRRVAVVLGALLVAGGIAVGSAPGAAPAPGLVYAGETSNGELVTIEVNAAHTRVTKLRYVWSSDCVPGPAGIPTTPTSTAWNEYHSGYPVNHAGAWSKTSTVTRLGENGTTSGSASSRRGGARRVTSRSGRSGRR